MFRNLKENEIKIKTQYANEKGCSLVLYVDSRTCMNILDEIGLYNWKREHKNNNQNCIISIYDNDKKEWISKEDVGCPGVFEKEKSLASSSFKRACANWGIARELYSAPFIFVKGYTHLDKNKKYVTKEKFKVSSLSINKKTITKLIIIDSKGKRVFEYFQNFYDEVESDVEKTIVKEELNNYKNIEAEHAELRRKAGIEKIKLLSKYKNTQLNNILSKMNIKNLNNASLKEVMQIYKQIA